MADIDGKVRLRLAEDIIKDQEGGAGWTYLDIALQVDEYSPKLSSSKHGSATRRETSFLNPRLETGPATISFRHEKRIVCAVLANGTQTLRVCNVYAPNVPANRKSFFRDLNKYLSTVEPTILCGDFNCVENPSIDKRGGSQSLGAGGSRALKNLCSQYDLVDSWRLANPQKQAFTWRPKDNSVACRLDRIYTHKQLTVQSHKYTPAYFTDHDGFSVSVTLATSKKTGPCKCNVSILKDFSKDFEDNFRDWCKLKPGFESLGAWWDNIKVRIKSLVIKHSCRLARQKRDSTFRLNNTLVDLTNQLNAGDSSPSTLQAYEATKGALAELAAAEVQGAIVRSRIQSFEEGEECTSFFLRQAVARSKQKAIPGIRAPNGQIVRDEGDILHVFKEFYGELYREEPVDPSAADDLCENLENTLESDEADQLEVPLALQELEAALQNMQNNKCPGSDGLPKEFYATYWHLLRRELLEVFQEAFESGELCPSQRYGILTLLPKKGDELDPKNRRPISLLNTDYKLLTKALNNRLKSVVASVLHTDQTCGVPGRSIGNNLRLMRDVVVYANAQNVDCAVVYLDQAKAFDRVNVGFLQKTLTKMGFGPIFRRWISILYNNISSSVLVNGALSAPFALSRGVRQGCPLSPLLYAISLEPFAATVRKDPEIHGLCLPGGHEVKLSMDADDNSAVLTTDGSIVKLFSVVELYNKGSGSLLNMGKCEGLWLGRWKNRPDSPVNIKWTSVSVRLLGGIFGNINMPLVNWRERQTKFQSTLQLWSARALSFSGKVTVANSLATAKLWYIASVFLPPESVSKELTAALCKFVWNNQKGGWGLVDVTTKAQCLYARTFSDILTNSDLPWVQPARYWLGFFVRRFDPSTWSNCAPHSPDPPPHYSSLRRLVTNMVDPSSPSHWDTGCTVRSLYSSQLRNRAHSPSVCSRHPNICWPGVFMAVHHPFLENRLKDISWKVAHGALKTNGLVGGTWRYRGSSNCPRQHCRQVESVDHAMFYCSTVLQTWTWVEGFARRWVQPDFRLNRPMALLNIFPPDLGRCRKNVLIYIFAVVKHKIWASRCKAVFEQSHSSHTELITSIKESLRSKLRTEFVRLGASNFEASWCDSVGWAKTEGDRLRLRF
ncbi:hypothetical protein Bbelb_373520 [Branchiostoma belcheri]|nr:hypothetical protein Bbelb_373520 [Branchiostoma belcheri]